MRSVRKGLPRQVDKGGHLEAMLYVDVPALMQKLVAAAPTTGRDALRCIRYVPPTHVARILQNQVDRFAQLGDERSPPIKRRLWDKFHIERGIDFVRVELLFIQKPVE